MAMIKYNPGCAGQIGCFGPEHGRWEVFGLHWIYFVLYFIVPFAIGGLHFYLMYRMFIAGKITVRPLLQGLIALGVAIILIYLMIAFFPQFQY